MPGEAGPAVREVVADGAADQRDGDVCGVRQRLGRWSVAIRDTTTDWLGDDDSARVYTVDWTGATATVEITTEDGITPPIDDRRDSIAAVIPSFVGVVVNVGQGRELRVQ